jgi:hypothetical protein
VQARLVRPSVLRVYIGYNVYEMPQLRGGISGWYTSTDATDEKFIAGGICGIAGDTVFGSF